MPLTLNDKHCDHSYSLKDEEIQYEIQTTLINKDPVFPKVNFSSLLAQSSTYHLPKNTSSPVNSFTDMTCEQMPFPTLFPVGINGLKMHRQSRLSCLEYFKSRLLSADKRWSSHLPYLFWATNSTEKQTFNSNISFALRSSFSNSKNNDVVTTGDVQITLTTPSHSMDS